MTGTPWYETPLVAIDLEGSGAQDRDQEAILEIAAVPITGGQPEMDNAYCTLVNPGRPVPKRPWISPGLTNHTLRDAPTLDAVEPALAARLNGCYLVGHNIAVDWRLLHRRCPTIEPAGLIDTLRLARHLDTTTGNGLAQLVAAHDLTIDINTLAVGSQPHRALWDAVAAVVLLGALTQQRWKTPPTFEELSTIARLRLDSLEAGCGNEQPSLFDV